MQKQTLAKKRVRALPAGDPDWIDLRLALTLDCFVGDELVGDWHRRGPMPGLRDIPFLQSYEFDGQTRSVSLALQERADRPPTVISGDVADLDEAKSLMPSPLFSADAIAQIKDALAFWVASNCHMILKQAKSGHLELSGRPNSLFADERAIPDHILPHLESVDLTDGRMILSNGEVIYAVKARLKDPVDMALATTSTHGLKAKLLAVRETPKLRVRLQWLIAKTQAAGLAKKAKVSHGECEDDLKLNWKQWGVGAYRPASLRTFAAARELYREIAVANFLDQADKILR